MADLYNNKLRQIERNVPESEIQKRIISGAYDFLGGPDLQINLDTGDGKPNLVPAHKAADYIRDGARYLTSPEVQKMRDNNEFAESALGQLAAIPAGLDQYGLAGMGSHILEASGAIDKGSTEAVQAANPWTNHTAGVLGTIVAILSGGTTAAAGATAKGVVAAGAAGAAQKGVLRKGAEAVTESAAGKLMSYSLPGIGARVARAAESGINKQLLQHGKKAIPDKIANSAIAKRWGPHVAKTVSSTIGAGIEGGIWGTGAGISEAIVGEPEESAEHLLDSITDNMLMGMAFGGGVSLLSPFLAGVKGAAVNAADSMMSFSGKTTHNVVGKKLNKYITKVAVEAGLPPESVSWLHKALDEGGDNMIKELEDFIGDLHGNAADTAKVFDILRIADQFVQISDVHGFKLDVLIDAAEATVARKGIHHNIAEEFAKDDTIQALKSELRKKTKAYTLAKKSEDSAISAMADDILPNLKAIREKIVEREAVVRRSSRFSHMDAEYKLPDTMKGVVDNTKLAYQEARGALLRGVDNPGVEADAVETIIRDINKSEVTLYEQMFSDENFERIAAKIREDAAFLGGSAESKIAALKESFQEARRGIKSFSDEVEQKPFYTREGPDRSFRITNAAKDGIMDYIPEGASHEFKTMRQVVDEALLKMDYNAFDPRLAAVAFKSLEDIQTTALKHLQYGGLAETISGTDNIQQRIISALRKEMTDVEKWGQMAKLKDEFDTTAKQFGSFREQVLGDFTSPVGLLTPGDPQAFLGFIRQLDNNTINLKMDKLNGYGDTGRNLLEFIKHNFEAIEPNNLPAPMQGTIRKRLKEIEEIGFKMGDDVIGEPGLSFDDRLERMIGFSRKASDDIGKRLQVIKEKLPLADAFLSTSARNQNLANLISDIGRGGAASTLAYATTGSKIAAATAGVMVGSASMALSPERYLNLIRQMSILKKTNKKIIEEYMDDWARNTVPKSAITKNWEQTSRSMLMVAAQPFKRDTRESRSEMRRRIARGRHIDNWSDRITEALNSELNEESYFEASTSIKKLSGSRFLMDRYTNEMTAMFEQTPDIRNSMKASMENRINIANSLLPRETPGTAFSDPIPPTSMQLQEFGRHLQILNSPKDTVLTAMLTGTLTAEMVSTFRQAWPELYSEIVTAAMAAISDDDGKIRSELTSTQRLALATLTGTSLMEASVMEKVSNTFAEEKEKGPGPGGGGGGAGRPRIPRPMDDSVGASSSGLMSTIVNR